MSYATKAPIFIPNDIYVKISNNVIFIKGKLGELYFNIHKYICIIYDNEKIIFSSLKKDKLNLALIGTTRSIINNMIYGVTYGFYKKLHLVGVGYKVNIEYNTINLSIGFSHLIKYELPLGIKADCLNQNEIIISGLCKQLVNQVAANIRSYKIPESYKGKGIHYENEVLKLKECKKKS